MLNRTVCLKYRIVLGAGLEERLHRGRPSASASDRDIDVVFEPVEDGCVVHVAGRAVRVPREARQRSGWSRAERGDGEFTASAQGVTLRLECGGVDESGVAAGRAVAAMFGLAETPAHAPLITAIHLADERTKEHLVSMRFVAVVRDVEAPRPRASDASSPPRAQEARSAAWSSPAFIDPGFAPGHTGHTSFAVSDAWLDDNRSRFNRMLQTMGEVNLRSVERPATAEFVLPWLERLQAPLKDDAGNAVNLVSRLRDTLRLIVAFELGTKAAESNEEPPTEQEVEQETTARLKDIVTLRSPIPFHNLELKNDFIVARVWDMDLTVNIGAAWIDELRTVADRLLTDPTGLGWITKIGGVQFTVVIPDASGWALYSLQPASQAASIALNIATMGAFSMMISNGGPIFVSVSEMRVTARLVPSPDASVWTVAVDACSLRAQFGALTTNLLNLPVALLGSQIAAAGLEIDLTKALEGAFRDVSLPLGWPARMHTVGAPEHQSGKAYLVEGVATALMASPAPFYFESPYLLNPVPVRAGDRVLYHFSEDFVRAWVESVCGAMRTHYPIDASLLASANIALPKPAATPPSAPPDPAKLQAKLRKRLGPLGALPWTPVTAAPSNKTEVRATLKIDSFDIVLVPQPDVAFSLVVRSTFLIETVLIKYGLAAEFVPEQCVREVGGTLGGIPRDPIDPIAPLRPRLGPSVGPRPGGRPPGGSPRAGGLVIGGTSIPLCNPPHVNLQWIPSQTVIHTHLRAEATHTLDVQVGLQVDIKRPLDTLVFPAAALRAPAPAKVDPGVRSADPALDDAATWTKVGQLIDALLGQLCFGRLTQAAEILPRWEFNPLYAGVLFSIGQAAGAPYQYRKEGANLIWDIDVVEYITDLFPD